MWQIWIVPSAGGKHPPDGCGPGDVPDLCYGTVWCAAGSVLPPPPGGLPRALGSQVVGVLGGLAEAVSQVDAVYPAHCGSSTEQLRSGAVVGQNAVCVCVCVCVCVFDAYTDSRCVETGPGASVIGRF